jgi:hypothetical protein
MGFWTKSLRIFNLLCGNGKQSVRDIARKTGFSKSSVHRLEQAMERRNCHPESGFWETGEGRNWLIRLVVATLYTFGVRFVGSKPHEETREGDKPHGDITKPCNWMILRV